MKIFVSYSRKDAGDFAQQIQRYFTSFKYDIFTDTDSIRVGETWDTAIETNISSSDIFVVIITYGALQSPHIDNEVLQAQKEKKRIIPCIHRTLRDSNIKWGLNKIQGVEFDDKFELARNLYAKIIQNKSAVKSNDESDTSKIEKNPHIDSLELDQKGAFDSNYKSGNRDGSSVINVRKTKAFNLKILIPSIVAVVGVVIAVIVFGSGIVPQPLATTNHPPVANDQKVITNKNTPVHITLSASDPEVNDVLKAQIVSLPSDGRLSDINQTSGIVTYTPNPGFTGTDKFTFKINDGKVDSIKIGTVSLAVRES